MHPQKSMASMKGFNTKVVSDSEIPGSRDNSAALLFPTCGYKHLTTTDPTGTTHNLPFICFGVLTCTILSSLQGSETHGEDVEGHKPPRNPEDDPCPPAVLGHPLSEGPDHSDPFPGISANSDSLRRRTSWGCRPRLCRDPPYLAFVEQRLLGLGGLDGQVRLPLLQQVLRHQRDPPPRPAGGTTRSHPDRTPAPSRIPTPLGQPPWPPPARGWRRIPHALHSSLCAALTPPTPPFCRVTAAHALGWGGAMAAPPQAPLARPGSAERRTRRNRTGRSAVLAGLALGRGHPRAASPGQERPRGHAVLQPHHPQVVPEPHVQPGGAGAVILVRDGGAVCDFTL